MAPSGRTTGLSEALVKVHNVEDLATVRGQSQKPWQYQCDYQEDQQATDGLPDMPVPMSQLQAPWEEDKLVEFWQLSLEGESATGPLAFVEAIWFQSIVGGVIFANAIIIGLETDVKSPYWTIVEQCLLIFFVAELSLRLLHFGVTLFLKQTGNLFDVLIVFAGVFDMWFVPVYNYFTGGTRQGRSAFMSTIQMLRLLRIIRLVRLVKIVQPLYRLALGIAEAIQGMFWVLIFLVMMLYATAILLTRLLGHGIKISQEEALSAWGISNAPPDTADEVRAMFTTVSSSMFVLFESMSCWSLIQFTPLFQKIPMLKLSAVLFYIFSVWALLAVMTGVVSEKMIAVREGLNNEEREHRANAEKVSMKALRELFEKADADGSGEISKEEFSAMLMWTDITKQLMQYTNVNSQDLNELFDWLDQDKDGNIAIDEFVQGFFWLNDSISPKSFLKLQEKLAREMRALQKRLCDHANVRFDTLINVVHQPLRKIHAVTEQIQRLDVQISNKPPPPGVADKKGNADAARAFMDGNSSVRNDRLVRGPASRQELQAMEERLNGQIDELLGRLDTLKELQERGLVYLVQEPE